MIYMTKSFYTLHSVALIPNVMIVFGDNLERVGCGGQAIIRGLPNAIGVATKRSCSQFMTGTLEDALAVIADLRRIEGILMTRQSVLFPINKDGTTSLGCGLAELPTRAPALYGLINEWFQRLPYKREVTLQ